MRFFQLRATAMCQVVTATFSAAHVKQGPPLTRTTCARFEAGLAFVVRKKAGLNTRSASHFPLRWDTKQATRTELHSKDK
jgi:hypothetical protein